MAEMWYVSGTLTFDKEKLAEEDAEEKLFESSVDDFVDRYTANKAGYKYLFEYVYAQAQETGMLELDGEFETHYPDEKILEMLQELDDLLESCDITVDGELAGQTTKYVKRKGKEVKILEGQVVYDDLDVLNALSDPVKIALRKLLAENKETLSDEILLAFLQE